MFGYPQYKVPPPIVEQAPPEKRKFDPKRLELLVRAWEQATATMRVLSADVVLAYSKQIDLLLQAIKKERDLEKAEAKAKDYWKVGLVK